MERTTVKPGELVAAFEIKGGQYIERELVNERGEPCNSLGGPLPVRKKRSKKK